MTAADAAAAAGAVWACGWRLCSWALLHQACDAQQRGRSIVSALLLAAVICAVELWPTAGRVPLLWNERIADQPRQFTALENRVT
jgi:hypothetical protein